MFLIIERKASENGIIIIPSSSLSMASEYLKLQHLAVHSFTFTLNSLKELSKRVDCKVLYIILLPGYFVCLDFSWFVWFTWPVCLIINCFWWPNYFFGINFTILKYKQRECIVLAVHIKTTILMNSRKFWRQIERTSWRTLSFVNTSRASEILHYSLSIFKY